MKKAVVLGGTGMVGSQLIKLLIEDKEYSEIVSLVRRSSGILDPKLIEIVVNFDQFDNWNHFITGDVLFSTLGTTIAQAKTKAAQFRVDYTYQFTVAQIAAQNKIQKYVLVSSAGANANSKTFYLNMKGKLETAIQTLPFKVISIIRPGQLDGNRTRKRTGEKIALTLMYFFNKLGLFKHYKPIQANEVALAMIHAARKDKSAIYTLDQVFELANINQ